MRFVLTALLLTTIFLWCSLALDQEYSTGNCPSQLDEGSSTTCSSFPPVAASSECGVWVAQSSLPGTGIGLFAGKAFRINEELIPNGGDLLLPFTDLLHHNDKDGDDLAFFLWDQYTWDAEPLRCQFIGTEEVNVASPGFGAATNSFMDFVNAEEGRHIETVAQGLHRSKDPGAGAFSYWHSRMTTASAPISPGDELFVSYGNKWFETRINKIGPIPRRGDHLRAQMLLTNYNTKRNASFQANADEDFNRTRLTAMWESAWDVFVTNQTTWPSPVIAALPPKEQYPEMLQTGLVKMRQKDLARSEEWLEANGVCADHLRMGESTLAQAGHGAFAVRNLPGGSAILSIPMIHIPYRVVLTMRPIKVRHSNETAFELPSHQLLLNYCLGHENSTMLLSPYGHMFSLVNHNQTRANVRLQWASPERSSHHPEFLERNVSSFLDVNSAVLAMELIALRDIEAGEEVLLDYGVAFEQAWQKHVREWKPPTNASSYVSAQEFNAKRERLRTEFEQMVEPYPSNVAIKFDTHFEDKTEWMPHFNAGESLERVSRTSKGDLVDCDVLRYKKVGDQYLYSIAVKKEDSGFKLVEAPHDAFVFIDRPYTHDTFLPSAFRHEMAIPDDLFPVAWENM